MQLTISAADLARRLCGFTHASGSITLTIEDERIRSQILALLLPVPQSAEARNPPVIYRATADGSVTFDVPPASASLIPEGPPWQCGDILEEDRGHHPILVGYFEQWIEVWPHDRAEDFAPRVWSEARAFENFGPFRRIGCVAPVVVLRARSGDEEAAAAIVRAAYPEGDED